MLPPAKAVPFCAWVTFDVSQAESKWPKMNHEVAHGSTSVLGGLEKQTPGFSPIGEL